MKLIMTLLVRDEEDILEANIDFHLGMGVDHFIVTDNRSIDSTKAILDKYVRQGLVTYLYEDADNFDQEKWVTGMARLAAEKGASWVLNSDADEFWVPCKKKNLKKYFSGLFFKNIVVAQRHDFVCVDEEVGKFYDRMIYRRRNSLNPLGAPLPPKVAHKANKKVVAFAGNHSVGGFKKRRVETNSLEVLHFPLRSRRQYEKKILTGGKAFSNNNELPESTGATWRKQYTELKNGGSLKYIENNICSREDIARLLDSGELDIYTGLRDFFRESALTI